MKKYNTELSVGVFVLVGLLCTGYLTLRLGNLDIFSSDGYMLTASFNSVTGLKSGSTVMIAGVPVGKVTNIELEPGRDYRALVTMKINSGVRFGDDASASIKTSGLIGDKYVNISPSGYSTTILENGDEIEETLPLFDLEDLIGKFVVPGVGK